MDGLLYQMQASRRVYAFLFLSAGLFRPIVLLCGLANLNHTHDYTSLKVWYEETNTIFADVLARDHLALT